uniref:RING-type domain-containing protein n=1 Tax=Macrostomum lignano TaxID=282301 RepID=A0A1I8GWW4_9PLAT
MLRARSEGLECVAELEGMLKFCDFFLEQNGDVEMSNVFADLKERGLLTSQDNSTQLLQWRAFANALTDSEDCNDRLISAEISFYYTVLSGTKLSENLLEDIVKKIFDSILPVGFVAILWNKIKYESKELLPCFGELMEGCKSLEKRCSIYSIIATFLTTEEQSEWTQDLSSKMVEFSEEFLTVVLPLVSEFICIVMKAVLLDIERVKSSSSPASGDLQIEEKFRQLQNILHLSNEETTWLLHSIMENKEELFFKVPQSDSSELFENMAFFVGKHVLKAMHSIREFKHRRMTERRVVENFALACLVDNVDLSDDQLPSELMPPGRSKEDVKAIAANPLFFPKRQVTFDDACMLFDCQLAEGERRPLMHLILRFSDKLVGMRHASKLVHWHQTVLKKSENVLSQEELEAMRIDDFIRRFRNSDILESAATAYRALRPSAAASPDNPFDKTRSLLSSLLTDRTEVTKVLKEAVDGVNEFFEHVAVLCIEEKHLPELLGDDGSCVLPLCDVVTRPDSVPSCSKEELDELVRVLASCPGGGDPSVHWELLEAALAKRLLASKGFGCVEPWEGRLKGATERDLGTLVSAFRQMCQCERLSEAELAAFQRRQKEDSSRAARTAALCRTLLGFCHRIGVPNGACTIAEFLQQHAGSLAGGAALAEAEAEGAGGLALSKVPALLEAAEQEHGAFSGHEEAAERVAASVLEGDKPTLLALLKSACVRLLMADSTQCGLTMADLLADASLLPVGAPELRLRSDPALDKPAVELLFPLAHCLHRSEQNKTKGQRKFQKLLNRM